MKTSDPSQLLRELIATQEAERDKQEAIVREQLFVTYESLKPINLLKSTMQQAVHSPEIRNSVVNMILGRVSGFIAKQFIQSGSHNPLVKLTATITDLIVTNQITNNAEEIRAIGVIVLKKILNHQRTSDETNQV